jgi:hypothetical protein
MEKQEIDSILLANFYFLKCKFENPLCTKTDLARRFLNGKIRKALNKKVEKPQESN